MKQRPKHFFQILISRYSPPLYQLSYQWTLSYEDPIAEMKLLPYKIWYFLELLVENRIVSTQPDLNQRVKDYLQISISHCSPPLNQQRYRWNLSYEDARTEIKLLPYKMCYFFKLSAENSTASTEQDLNMRPKDYCEILISHYSPPLYELSYQWNLSDSDSGIEMTLLPCKCAIFLKLLVENSSGSTEPDLKQRPKDYCQILMSHYSPPLYQLSYYWNLSDEYASTEMKLLPYKICFFLIVSRKQLCID